MDSFDYADPEQLNGLNLYVYCANNPVMGYDPVGTTAWWEWLLLAVAVTAVVVAGVVATVATGGTALVAGGIAIGGSVAGVTDIVGQGLSKGWDNISVGEVAASIFIGGTVGGAGGAGMASGAYTAGAFALAGGGSSSAGTAIAGAGLFALNILFSKWIPGSWPGDDPTVSPGDGFEWRGRGDIGSDKGAWFNPETHDSLHPDLNHPAGISPHWDYVNRLLKIFKRIFK